MNDTLAAIARGEQADGLLHNARLLTDSGEAYGVEAVVAHFRAAPLTVSTTLGDDGTLASVADGTMIVADTYDGRVARLWRVGSDGPVAREPRIDVAFDPDMQLARGDLFVSPSDFPHVPAERLDLVRVAARDVLAGDRLGPAATRQRLFLLRVARSGDRLAALFAWYRLAAGARHDARFRHAALLLDGAAGRWFVDRDAAPQDWTPRV